MLSPAIPGLEVIKLEYCLKLKIKSKDWLLADTDSIYQDQTAHIGPVGSGSTLTIKGLTAMRRPFYR